MAELGLSKCDYSGCNLCDFLPYRCAACGQTFCQLHFSIKDHNCEKGQSFLKEHAHNFDEGIASSACQKNDAGDMISAKRYFESSVDTSKDADSVKNPTHFGRNVLTTSKIEEEKRLKNRISAKLFVSKERSQHIKSEQGKRIASRVHRLLMKTHASGNPNIRMEDRFFLEVECCCSTMIKKFQTSLTVTWDESIRMSVQMAASSVEQSTNARCFPTKYIYFSKLSFLKKVVDKIAVEVIHRDCMCVGEEQELRLFVFETGAVLGSNNHPMSELSSAVPNFSRVVLFPSKITSMMMELNSIFYSSDISAATPMDPENCYESVETTASPASVAYRPTAVGYGTNGGSTAAALTVPDIVESDSDVSAKKPQTSIILVTYQKSKYEVNVIVNSMNESFGGEATYPRTVADLKLMLEKLTGVSQSKQKLIFKGVTLKNSATFGECGIAEGSKVMMLGNKSA